jgi:hypothetical protein
MERHQRFELDAIACTKFEELIAHIFSALAQTSELEMVTLMLLDPRQELAAMLADVCGITSLSASETDLESARTRQQRLICTQTGAGPT